MNDLKEKILQGTLKSLETFSINKLKKVIRNSEEEKREQGLLFCGSTDIPPFGDISHSDLCTGTKCTVVMKDCKGKKEIGAFHTHPHNKDVDISTLGHLSGEDIYSSIFNRRRFSCIGVTEDNKPVIKCFVPEFDIVSEGGAIMALKSFMAQDNYHKKLSEYNLSERKPDGTKKTLEQLLSELPADKRPILSDTYTKWIIADDELYRESKSLAKKLLSKEADLIIR